MKLLIGSSRICRLYSNWLYNCVFVSFVCRLLTIVSHLSLTCYASLFLCFYCKELPKVTFIFRGQGCTSVSSGFLSPGGAGHIKWSSGQTKCHFKCIVHDLQDISVMSCEWKVAPSVTQDVPDNLSLLKDSLDLLLFQTSASWVLWIVWIIKKLPNCNTCHISQNVARSLFSSSCQIQSMTLSTSARFDALWLSGK